jgi:hypothetical protein
MTTTTRHELLGCEGFRIESPQGLLGWVEETWLGSAGEPAALAVRMIDGRDCLLLPEEVKTVVRESELITTRDGARLLKLDLPRIDAASTNGLSAAWRTTGEVLEPPEPPGAVARTLLGLRLWRLAPPPRPEFERPLWVSLVVLYSALTLIVGLVIALCFLIAWAATGYAV